MRIGNPIISGTINTSMAISAALAIATGASDYFELTEKLGWQAMNSMLYISIGAWAWFSITLAVYAFRVGRVVNSRRRIHDLARIASGFDLEIDLLISTMLHAALGGPPESECARIRKQFWDFVNLTRRKLWALDPAWSSRLTAGFEIDRVTENDLPVLSDYAGYLRNNMKELLKDVMLLDGVSGRDGRP